MLDLVGGLPPVAVDGLALNDSQERALIAASRDAVTVVTGPPGTGKSQLVAALVANQWVSGRSVLVASTNNGTVDVAARRCASLDEALLIRTGNRDQRDALPAVLEALAARGAQPGPSRAVIRRQLEAGADAVQIFDSWASGLPDSLFESVVIRPTRAIVRKVRAARPDAWIIGFPRAATLAGYEQYARCTGVDALSLDTAAPMGWAARTIAPLCAVQGNLDPLALIAGGAALDGAIDRILEAMAGTPFIFNLGHGILPETPVAHVEHLLKRIRGC